jgi:hypothetical protein
VRVDGTIRVVTDTHGKISHFVGIHPEKVKATLHWPNGRSEIVPVPPNTIVPVDS